MKRMERMGEAEERRIMDHKELTAKNANDAKKDGNKSFRDFSVFGGSKNELLFKKEIVILNLIQNLNVEQSRLKETHY